MEWAEIAKWALIGLLGMTSVLMFLFWVERLSSHKAFRLDMDRCPNCNQLSLKRVQFIKATIEINGRSAPDSWSYHTCEKCGQSFKCHRERWSAVPEKEKHHLKFPSGSQPEFNSSIAEVGDESSINEGPVLKRVGYWKETQSDSLPSPTSLVELHWQSERKREILNYLSNGVEIQRYLGYSFCRFACGIENCGMGSADLTDGEWVWPEGLAHYVEWHDVQLPDDFVKTMGKNGFIVPNGLDVEALAELSVSEDFWISWCKRFG